MGQTDNYILSQVQPSLWPNERVCWLGFVRRPQKVNYLGVAAEYRPMLAAATDRRLILIKTASRTLSLTDQPKLENRGVTVWRYDQLREIQLDKAPGITSDRMIRLCPHEPLGPHEGRPKRYDIAVSGDGLDGQAAFSQQWPAWLQQQITAGAFPLTAEDQQQIHAHRHAQQLAAAQERSEQAARAQRIKQRNDAVFAFLTKHSFFIAAACLTLGLLGTVVMAENAFSNISFWQAAAEDSERDAKEADEEARELKRDEGEDVDKEELRELKKAARDKRDDAERELASATHAQLAGMGWSAASLLILAAAAAMAAVGWRRRRDALVTAARQL